MADCAVAKTYLVDRRRRVGGLAIGNTCFQTCRMPPIDKFRLPNALSPVFAIPERETKICDAIA